MRGRARVGWIGAIAILGAGAVPGSELHWAGIGPPGGSEVRVLAVSPSFPGLFYAVMGNALWKTTDGGATWSEIPFGFEGPSAVTALAVDPLDRTTVYAGTALHGIPENPPPGNVYKSTDGGGTWTRLANFPGLSVQDLTPAPPPSRLLFAATSAGIFCTPNGGTTWIFVGASGMSVNTIRFSPSSPSIAYAGAADGIYKSTNGGDAGGSDDWSGARLRERHSLAIDPHVSLLSTREGGLVQPVRCPAAARFRKTADGGATWTVFGIAPDYPAVRSFLVGSDSTRSCGNVRLGYFPVEGSWRDLGRGERRPCQSLDSTLVSDGSTIYAGTGSGLFKSISGAACSASATALCLAQARFRVEVAWTVSSLGRSGAGRSIPLSVDTGAFWFFQPSNIELVVKVLDGRGINGRFWVFYGALSNVGYTITVTDTATGEVRTYTNAEGQLASHADTDAF